MKQRRIGVPIVVLRRLVIALLLATTFLQAQHVSISLNSVHSVRIRVISDTVSASCNGPAVFGRFTMASQGHGDGTINICTGNCPPYWSPGCKYIQGEAWNDAWNVNLEACDAGTGVHCDGPSYELAPGGYKHSVGDIYVVNNSNAEGDINPPGGPIGTVYA